MDGLNPVDVMVGEAAGPVETEETDTDIAERARECYRVGTSATAEWRRVAIEDLKFLAGEQWDPNYEGQRKAENRPVLTVNRLPQFLRQVTNEQRQAKPSVTVNPVDSGADVRTAEVFQGVIRNIEHTSNADAAYAAGGQSAAATGVGFWDVRAEYEDEMSFDQRLVIARIPNPLSIVMDPGAKELAGDDARWVIISTDVSESEFKAMFPDKEIPKAGSWSGEGDSAASWVAESGVRIHEYRWIQEEPDTLIETPEGPALVSELPEEALALLRSVGALERPTTRRKAWMARIVGNEVIEKKELAGKYLQLVRVVGGEIHIDGKTIYEGVIRHAKDSQKMLNFFVSAEAEAIGLTPKAPFVATAAQLEGHEHIWRTANSKTHAYLPYNPDPQAPPPQRVMAEANVSAITNARMQANEDLKATTGIYDAALGAQSNEKSGRAILARESQAQTANFHFSDNLGLAIRYTGRILLDLIPKIYSGPRVLRILGEDGKPEMVPVNGQPGEFRGEQISEENLIQLGAGRYDVTVSMGPSYQSRRQEAAAQLLELIRVNPGISQVAGDLLVESMDIPGGKEIAKRIRKTLSPDIRPPDEEKTPPPQVLMQQVQQASQMIEQLTAKLNETQDKLEMNAQELESKERIETLKAQTQITMKLAELDAQQSIELLRAEQALLAKRLAVLDFAEPVEAAQPQPPQGAINAAQ